MATIAKTCQQLYGCKSQISVRVPSGTDYEAGGLGCFGNMVGIALSTSKGGQDVVFAGDGVWRCKVKTGEGEKFSAGDKAYIDGETWEIIALPEEAGTYVCAGTVLDVDDDGDYITLVLNFFGETATVSGE